MLSHPEVPTCADCQKWMYKTDTWERVLKLQRDTDGEPRQLPLARQPGSPTPCPSCPKSGPKDGNPRPDKDLSDKNWQAYRHYVEAKAIGHFEDDPIVRRNAGIIRWAEDQFERSQAQLTPMLLMRGLLKRS